MDRRRGSGKFVGFGDEEGPSQPVKKKPVKKVEKKKQKEPEKKKVKKEKPKEKAEKPEEKAEKATPHAKDEGEKQVREEQVAEPVKMQDPEDSGEAG